MSVIRCCEFSCDLFAGFRTEVSLIGICDLEELTQAAVGNLKYFLERKNLRVLVSKLEGMKFHAHVNNGLSGVIDNEDITIWICDHDSSNDVHLTNKPEAVEGGEFDSSGEDQRVMINPEDMVNIEP